MLRWPDKDPADFLDYAIDWSRVLADDTIVTVMWTTPAGLIRGPEAITAALTTLWLAGGAAGTDYTVTCRITTVASRVIERSVAILVTDL